MDYIRALFGYYFRAFIGLNLDDRNPIENIDQIQNAAAVRATLADHETIAGNDGVADDSDDDSSVELIPLRMIYYTLLEKYVLFIIGLADVSVVGPSLQNIQQVHNVNADVRVQVRTQVEEAILRDASIHAGVEVIIARAANTSQVLLRTVSGYDENFV